MERVKVTVKDVRDLPKAKICEDFLNHEVEEIKKEHGIISAELIPVYGEDGE